MLRQVRGLACILAALVLLGLGDTAHAKIDTFEYYPAPDGTRVHFTMSGQGSYTVSTDDDTRRVLIEVRGHSLDLDGDMTKTSSLSYRANYDDVVLRQIQVRQVSGQYVVRIAVDLNVKPEVKHELIKLGWNRYRLSLDFRRPPDLVEQRYDLADIRAFKARGGKVALVSAGHGGLDDGNHGIGLVEKHVNLDVCLRLEEMLNKHRDQTGVMVVLARWGDYLPVYTKDGTWEWLVEMGDHYDADLFMEVHFNSCKGLPSQNGSEVFILSDYYLEKLAREEVDRLRDEGLSLGAARSRALSMKYENHRESQIFARKVIGEFDRIRGLATSRGLKRASFIALRRLDVPTILTEGGFLNDPHDHAMACEPDFRERMAHALGYAAVDYLTGKNIKHIIPAPEWNGPPVKNYVVRRGDSLSKIATSHGVSLNSLRSANGIRGSYIRVGQRLQIPGQSGTSLASAANNWQLLTAPRFNPSFITPPESPETTIYYVKAGETLWGISKKLDIPIAELLWLNGYDSLQEARIKVGQELRLPSHEVPSPSGSDIILTQLNKDYTSGDSEAEDVAESSDTAESAVDSSETTEETEAAPPVEVVEMAEAADESVDTAAAESAPKAEPRTHTVRKGESLYAIAKNYGIGLRDLQDWNEQLKNPNRLKPGDRLVVSNPATAAVLGQVQQDVAAAEAAEAKGDSGLDLVTYRVKPGQSLYLIAREFPGISAENIAKVNAITDPTSIKPGMDLVIPSSDETYETILNSPQMLAALSEDGADALPLEIPEPMVEPYQTYTVRKGETLWDIASQFPGVTPNVIASANAIKPSRIHPGDTLRIPVQAQANQQDSYVVKRGDSIWDIAKKFNIPVQRIRDANNLKSDVIQPDEVLNIPVGSGS